MRSDGMDGGAVSFFWVGWVCLVVATFNLQKAWMTTPEKTELWKRSEEKKANIIWSGTRLKKHQ